MRRFTGDQIVETLIRRANALAEELGWSPVPEAIEVAPITAPDVKLQASTSEVFP